MTGPAATEHARLVREGKKAFGLMQIRIAVMLSSPTDAANRMLLRRAIAERW
jgi:hypothetical protein